MINDTVRFRQWLAAANPSCYYGGDNQFLPRLTKRLIVNTTSSHHTTSRAVLLPLRPLLLLLLPLLAGTAGTGLFYPQIYTGLVPEHLIPESQGQDAITLLLAIPLLFQALRWLGRRDLRGSILAAGVLGYTAYVYIIYAYGGVTNWLFLAYIACLGLAASGLSAIQRDVRAFSVPSDIGESLPRRTVALFFWAISLLLAVLWIALAVNSSIARVPSEANLIIVTDLAFVIPALTLSGLWLWQARPEGVLLGSSLLVLLAVLMLSIVVGQGLKIMQGFVPQWGLVALFGAMAVGAIWLTIPVFRALSGTVTAKESPRIRR